MKSETYFQKLGDNFCEKVFFFKKYLTSPHSVGSVTPSSKRLGQKISKIINKLEPIKILELGSGTGAITHQIQNKNPTLVEIDPDLAAILRKKFPKLKILNSCALLELGRLDSEVGILMSIPLVNNPIKRKFIAAINQARREQKIKWCVTYTYGLSNPLPKIFFKNQKRAAVCFLNFPPASIWVYTQSS